MLMQEKLYDFSSDYRPSSVGDYSPVVVAAAVNLCRNTVSPRPHFNPYECSKYMPLYYRSKFFNEYSQLLSKPTSLLSSSSAINAAITGTTVPYLTMQLPIRPSTLTARNPDGGVESINGSDSTTTSITNNNNNSAYSSLPVKRSLDGSIKSAETIAERCENTRTQSVIMKVEDQRIVEVPTNELITRNQSNNNNVSTTSTETEEETYICKWVNCYR